MPNASAKNMTNSFFGYKKSRPVWLGGSCLQVWFASLLYSHRCRLNHKEVLNNKDRKNDDNKGEGQQMCRHRLVYFARL